jgi:hypothetical protein
MQRLFSIFPTGSAGTALVVLGSVVAVTASANTSAYWQMGFNRTFVGVAALVGLCWFLALLTPYCAVVLQVALFVATNASSRFQLEMSIVTASATVALGPGAYSVDARLFGQAL